MTQDVSYQIYKSFIAFFLKFCSSKYYNTPLEQQNSTSFFDNDKVRSMIENCGHSYYRGRPKKSICYSNAPRSIVIRSRPGL